MPADFFFQADWKHTAVNTPIGIMASAPLHELRGHQPILMMGGIHGDEPEGVHLANSTAEWLKDQSQNGLPLTPWVVIPCLNVDGFARKTRGNGRGVDLNRNYPSKSWKPEYTGERYYPGPSPASEPEIQAVVALIEEIRPRLIIHCHSWNPCVVATGHPAKIDAFRLSQSSGYHILDDIGYPTPGSLSQYGWYDNGYPVICIEEQDHLTDFSKIWPRFNQGMKAIFTDLSFRKDV